MKNLVFVYFIFLSQICFSQSKINSLIDNLKTETEVQKFVQSLSKNGDDHLAQFELKQIKNFDDNNLSPLLKRTADSLQIDKSFYKGDFDHNGKTDLLFIGDDKSCTSSQKNADGSNSCNTSVKVAFDFGDSVGVKTLLPNHNDFVVPVLTKINQKDFIQVFYDEISEDFTSETMFKHEIINKILTYKYGDFVEYNSKPKNLSISKIQFSTTGCFGSCPVFNLTINKNEKSLFYAEYHNFKKNGEINYIKEDQLFTTQIYSSDLKIIEEILNYIDFTNLKEDYRIVWSDDQTSTLAIEYGNGDKKIIRDYGLVGTYGLKLLYEKLFDFRFNQDWKKVKK